MNSPLLLPLPTAASLRPWQLASVSECEAGRNYAVYDVELERPALIEDGEDDWAAARVCVSWDREPSGCFLRDVTLDSVERHSKHLEGEIKAWLAANDYAAAAELVRHA